MQGYHSGDFEGVTLSVAFSAAIDVQLAEHFAKAPSQEDLTFAYWRPSRGATRYTAVLHRLTLPREGDRLLQGNVAFTASYVERVLAERPSDLEIPRFCGHPR
jgi:hypothetical protein